MPRPRFSQWIITPTDIEVLATQTYNVYLDLLDTFYPQIMIRQTWGATASGGSGLACTIYPGFAVDAAGTIEYADNGNTISMVSLTPGTSGTTRTALDLNAEQYPQHLKLAITNNDVGGNTCSVFIAGDR